MLRDGFTLGNYRADLGVTGSLTASGLANLIGTMPDLSQSTPANQPLYLPFSGRRYAYLPGVTGNYFSTPDSAAVSITGDIEIHAYVALNDWTVTSGIFVSHDDTAGGNRGFSFNMGAGGCLRFLYWPDGTTTRSFLSTVAPGFSAGYWVWLRVTRSASTGGIKFYTSDDGVSWVQLGSTVASTVEGMFDSTAALAIGASGNGAVGSAISKIQRLRIYSTIGGTNPVVDFDANRFAETTTNGATATMSTGEVFTLNCTGTKPAQIVGSSQVLADGSAHEMSLSQTLSQPVTDYFFVKAPTYINAGRLTGSLGNALVTAQIGGSPQLGLYDGGGSYAAFSSNLALNTYGVITAIHSGADSTIEVNGVQGTTGDPGTASTGGTVYLFGGGGSNYGNWQFKEWIRRKGVDPVEKRALLASLLTAYHRAA